MLESISDVGLHISRHRWYDVRHLQVSFFQILQAVSDKPVVLLIDL
jgi:hypothetical protein